MKPNPTPEAKSTPRSGSLWKLLPLLGATFLLGGCIAVDEAQFAFDYPIGADYVPAAVRQPEIFPRKILVLPVSGQVHDESRAEFERQFLAQLQERNPWVFVTFDGGNSLTPNLAISEDAALVRAREVNADAILQITLADDAVYSPLRLSADVIIEDVASRQPLFKMHADYDARNKLVSNSARRYYLKYIAPRDSPDRSLMILNNRQEFLRFTGYYTAKRIADAFSTSKVVKKAQPADLPPPATGPSFAPVPGETTGGK